ncbi:mechanosensitive ion channel protein MscS [Acrocarpospora phusangensis]|uniref:Mechanosensitive ion channel protein MscS n=1 Tax=Acrocarpospora phusangensis TaxID=1070424 RepID=A0A919UN05_9ACTN|nr:mechanosensitive ion channel family protein [Acrocarpospora phusangensis]GIH27439.1 mechanosensitive ion channel protein MscS [Acrocarpospora phusangensis]
MFLLSPSPSPTPSITPSVTPTPSPSPSPLIDLKEAGQHLVEACSQGDGMICQLLNALLPMRGAYPAWIQLAAGVADVILIVVLILVAAMVVRKIAHRLITRITLRAGEGVLPDRLRRTATPEDATSAILSERRRQRGDTLGSVLRSIASVVILGTAFLTIATKLGIPIAPLLTSVGVLGVAVGFGAQELVKDFIAGMFMLVEDQYGVGDVIDTGVAVGTVEAVTLRITRLRDADGKVWYVRNGTITRVGNESQGWSRAVIDVPVAYDADVIRVQELLKTITTELWEDSDFRDTLIVEEPQVFGMEQISDSAVIFRVSVKTVPGERATAAREVRRRIKRAFDENGLVFAA